MKVLFGIDFYGYFGIVGLFTGFEIFELATG